MKYFFDTEFIETGGSPRPTIDLISIGIISEDGREYYAISNEFDAALADDWVKNNVLSKLPTPDNPAWKSRSSIALEILEFVRGDEDPQFWAYYADYDWVVFCWLFGRMIDLPDPFPKWCRDLKQLLSIQGLGKVPFEPDNEHNALSDAVWTKKAYEWAMSDNVQ